MNIAIVDNNDSFTYIIADYLKKIKSAQVSIIGYNTLEPKTMNRYDKIVISPGPGLPDDFPKVRELIRLYYKSKPILGICLGFEAIATFFGCKLINLSLVYHGVAKRVKILGYSRLFKGVRKNFTVGLYHSWAVNNKTIPKQLRVTSISESNIIMSLEHVYFPVFGVQFHPESYITEEGQKIFSNFVGL